MPTNQAPILATIALPYANGQLHLGHMVEAVQADIWVRFQRQRGRQCTFVSGNDAHGTAVMLSAEKAGLSAEEWVEQIHADHARDYAAFQVGFDKFYTTHSPEDEALCVEFYQMLKARGDIESRVISQFFDEEKQLFLADRYVKGTCPKCSAPDQYGDNCEECGASYAATDLVSPYSVLSGQPPVLKESEHYFFKLNHYRDLLLTWIDSGALQPSVANKLKEWFGESLRDWDISRDGPYFGFEIPDHPGKYFYVWVDAPIGYIATTAALAKQRDDVTVDAYWAADSEAELVHFIGKDIVYFHGLFWPAMLHGAGRRLPSQLFVHGYLTVNGQKMSKSRGTFITADHYANTMDVSCLRYYFAAKLSADVEDIDLSLPDFMARVNSDLVGKFVNLASRCAGFIHKLAAGKLASALPDPALYAECVAAGESIADCYAGRHYNRAMREIMALADKANQYIDQQKPWVLAKQADQATAVQAICTQGLNLFRVLATYLQPVMPVLAEEVEAFLRSPLEWQALSTPLLDHEIARFKPLLQRITPEMMDKLSYDTINS